MQDKINENILRSSALDVAEGKIRKANAKLRSALDNYFHPKPALDVPTEDFILRCHSCETDHLMVFKGGATPPRIWICDSCRGGIQK